LLSINSLKLGKQTLFIKCHAKTHDEELVFSKDRKKFGKESGKHVAAKNQKYTRTAKNGDYYYWRCDLEANNKMFIIISH
jgi:hypothetical protein